MRSSVLAAVLALLQEGSADTARGAHSLIVTPDMRPNPAAQTPTCGDGAALRLRGGSREDGPLKLHHLPRSGLLTAELLGLLALKIFDVGAISALAPPARHPRRPARRLPCPHPSMQLCAGDGEPLERRGAIPHLAARRICGRNPRYAVRMLAGHSARPSRAATACVRLPAACADSD